MFTVLYFGDPDVVNHGCPASVLPQHIGNRCREQYVTRIAAVHHPLRKIDATACNIWFSFDVGNAIDRPSVDPHPQLDSGMVPQAIGEFHRTVNGVFGTAEKSECHPVARVDRYQSLLVPGRTV
jgi:hypothetical protein